MIRIAIDTNVIGYAEALDDPVRLECAQVLLRDLRRHELATPVQVAAELHRLVMRRKGLSASQARMIVARWEGALPLLPTTTAQTLDAAFHLAVAHDFQILDAIILAASAEAGCRLLLSEDVQDGFVWRGVTIVNPFAAKPRPMLVDLTRD